MMSSRPAFTGGSTLGGGSGLKLGGGDRGRGDFIFDLSLILALGALAGAGILVRSVSGALRRLVLGEPVRFLR